MVKEAVEQESVLSVPADSEVRANNLFWKAINYADIPSRPSRLGIFLLRWVKHDAIPERSAILSLRDLSQIARSGIEERPESFHFQ